MIFKYESLHQKSLKKIKGFIEKANKICIFPHISPDADALGSAYALAIALKKQNKIVEVLLNHKPNYCFFKDYENEFASYQVKDLTDYDLAITVDCANLQRLGDYYEELFESDPILLINLDHHLDNSNFGEINFVDPSYSCTGEIVFDLIEFLNISFDDDIAKLIYIAIVSDTGAFRYPITSSRTHYITSYLLRYNIDTNSIYNHLFENFTLEYLQIREKVIKSLEFFLDGAFAITSLRQDFYDSYSGNFSQFVRIGLSIKGVQITAHFIEKEPELTKISLRSQGNINVSKIAHYFSGGGHFHASSFVVNQDYQKTKELVVSYICDELKNILPS